MFQMLLCREYEETLVNQLTSNNTYSSRRLAQDLGKEKHIGGESTKQPSSTPAALLVGRTAGWADSQSSCKDIFPLQRISEL